MSIASWGKRAGALAVPFALAGCEAPLSALAPSGPIAQDVAWLWWVLLTGAALLTAMVLILVALGFRSPREIAETRWTLGFGVLFSLAVLTATLAAALLVGERILPHGPAVEVHAHARQWNWSFTTSGADGPVETQGVLHIPAGQPVDVLITSEDVIHSFWIPRLGGKMDAIPGRQNRLRLIADRPGTYRGQCAEFCGNGHSTMRFDVIAHDAANWPSAIGEVAE